VLATDQIGGVLCNEANELEDAVRVPNSVGECSGVCPAYVYTTDAYEGEEGEDEALVRFGETMLKVIAVCEVIGDISGCIDRELYVSKAVVLLVLRPVSASELVDAAARAP